MSIGYHIEINRRFGGHDGHETEWEVSTRSVIVAERVTASGLLEQSCVCGAVNADHALSFAIIKGTSGVWDLFELLVSLDDPTPSEWTAALAALLDQPERGEGTDG